MSNPKPSKVTIVWPDTGRSMECSHAAFQSIYSAQGWTLVAAPNPSPVVDVDGQDDGDQADGATVGEPSSAKSPAKTTTAKKATTRKASK